MSIISKWFGLNNGQLEHRVSGLEKVILQLRERLDRPVANKDESDLNSPKDLVPTGVEKRKAAMALNLCATSISRILATDSREVMEIEYQSILNNLNLQNMVKDESLLATFKSILDTVTFYRLQEGDRKRADARYRQKLNSAIWSVSSNGACFLISTAENPTPWALISGAVMAVGAFCNTMKTRSEAKIALADENWRLERSLVEQLHALRYSLFETAWRLSDRYGFEDAWRLTIPQIVQYNKILEEDSNAWRYFRLEQYRGCFEAYPYYWNELGESAFLAAHDLRDDERRAHERNDYLDKAEQAFRHFLENDMGLLREDVVSAAVRLRLVQIRHMRLGSWSKALSEQPDFMEKMIGMACSAPDLLTQAAMCFASSYSEKTRVSDQNLAAAIRLMELVVCQGYNCPTSTRLLSRLYLENEKEFSVQLSRLKENTPVGGVVDAKDVVGRKCWETDRMVVEERLLGLLGKQFNLAWQLSNGGLFVGSQNEVDEKVHAFVTQKSAVMDASVVDMLSEIWTGVKKHLNGEYLLLSDSMGVPLDLIAPVAIGLDAEAQNFINEYSGSITKIVSSKEDRCIEQERAINRLLDRACKKYIEDCTKVVFGASVESISSEDIERISAGIDSIETHISILADRNGIAKKNGGVTNSCNVFSYKVDASIGEKSFKEYCAQPEWCVEKLREKKGFRVTVEDLGELVKASSRIENDLERQGLKVRVYTEGSAILGLYAPILLAQVAHRIVTNNPDYEIVRYPKSIEVRYMRDDVHDLSEDPSFLESWQKEAEDKKNQFSRIGEEGKTVVKEIAGNVVNGLETFGKAVGEFLRRK